MKKWFTYGLVFCAVYIVFLLITVPARIVFNFVTLPSTLVVQGVSGTIWHGNIETIQYKNIRIEQVETRLSVLSLFTFNPQIDIEFGDALTKGPEGKLSISGLFNSLSILDADVLVAANDIAQHLPLPIPLTAKGNVNLTLEQLIFDKPFCQQAKGKINWSKSGVTALDESIKFGSLNADIGCEKGALAITISPDNVLGLNFSAFVRKGGVISGNGYLTPGSKFPEKLKSILPFLGNADSKGRYRLKL